MNFMTRLITACGIGFILIIGSSAVGAVQTPLRARADIQGAPGAGITGEAIFVQSLTGIVPTVLIVVKVSGLAPNSVHGIHIHEFGACAPPFTSAGGHYDPGPFSMSNPDANHPFHMGDLPNLVANASGVAVLEHRTSRITLSAGPLTVFDADGSAVIVHGNEDMGTTGVTGGSGGPRIACGIIVRDN